VAINTRVPEWRNSIRDFPAPARLLIRYRRSMSKTEGTDLGANICADVNEDHRIGLEEVIYILQWVSGMR